MIFYIFLQSYYRAAFGVNPYCLILTFLTSQMQSDSARGLAVTLANRRTARRRSGNKWTGFSQFTASFECKETPLREYPLAKRPPDAKPWDAKRETAKRNNRVFYNLRNTGAPDCILPTSAHNIIDNTHTHDGSLRYL
jgi:hypothetical protein